MEVNKKEGKLISIVLPVYNGEKYLEKALRSIVQQTYENFELIIVDDCSTDHTPDIIRRYVDKDKRIRCIRNVINLKLPKALNAGFAKANGVYLTWTSDDNCYKPNALEVMVKYLEGHNNIDMVYANYTEIDFAGKIIRKRYLEEPGGIVYKNVVGACFLYRHEIAKCVGEYDANLFLAEDYDYWIRISKVGMIAHIADNLYYYRIHRSSLTSDRCDMAVTQTYRVLEKHFLYLYSFMKKDKDKINFLKKLEDWGKNLNRKQVQLQLCCVYPRYRYIAWYRNLGRSIYEFAYKMKGKLC